MKSEHTLILFGSGLLAAIAACAATTKIKNTNEINNLNSIISKYGTTGANGQNLIQVDSNTLQPGSFPLNYGDSNTLVYNMQVAINKNSSGNFPNSNLSITGVFDQATADILCSDYFDTCFGWYPDSLKENYSIQQTDYNAILG